MTAPGRKNPREAAVEVDTGLGSRTAAALVFGSSAAVLVVEIVALRLLAPHYGLTLETSTLVIGVALTAIAVGSWAGGHAADLVPARRLIGPLLGISGVAVASTPFLVRGAAATGEAGLLLLAATLTLLVPGALLSAVTPVATKLRLTSLRETGTVVGRLSAIGTVGAIAGTVVTGFVLISRVSVTGILVGLGIALVLASVLVQALGGGGRRGGMRAAGVVVLAGAASVVVPGGCDVETNYHCLAVQVDPKRDTGSCSSMGCDIPTSTSRTRRTSTSRIRRRWHRSSRPPSRRVNQSRPTISEAEG